MKLLNYQADRALFSLFLLYSLLTGCQTAMNQNNTFCMVLTTCPNQQEADTHARAIIEKHLGACVQSSAVHSHYMWEGKVQSDPEILLRIKTTCERYIALEQ